MPSLCLNMIVKNESHIIVQTLDNLCKYFDLDYWVISDTGSSDNTIEIIQNFFKNKGIDGEIHQHEWQNFCHNRNLALDACKDKADYILFFDADDLIEGELQVPVLELDDYYFNMANADKSLKYPRQLIIKNNGKFRWRGVLHEVLYPMVDLGQINSSHVLGEYLILSRRLGARNHNPDKALHDAQMLEKAFIEGNETEVFLARYAFYCAQSYMDYSQKHEEYIEQSIDWYRKRIAFKTVDQGFDDEKYVSYEVMGLQYERLQQYQEAYQAWQNAIELDPLRAECWYHLARSHHWRKNFNLAYCFAKQAIDIKLPEGVRIFLKNDIYHFWCIYEMCALAWSVQKFEESYQYFKKLIKLAPVQLIDTLEPILSDFKPYMDQDIYANVIELERDFENINRLELFKKIAFK